MDNLIFEIADKDKHNDILEFLMGHFCKNEPISRSVGMTRENSFHLIDNLVSQGLSKPVSFVCLNDRKKIVGCRLNDIVDKEASDKKSCQPEDNNDGKFSDTELKIVTFLDELCADLDQCLSDCRKYMKFIIVSVDENYQRRGIASRLIELSFEKARNECCQYVVATATAHKSQQMFRKMNFQILKTVEHKDYVDEHGRPVFKCDDETHCGQLVVKKL